MKKTLSIVALSSLLGLGAVEFKLDPSHSSVDFKIKHLLVSNVGGSFKKFDGRFDIDSKSKKINTLEGTIEISSIDTGNAKRDEHLLSADFFNASKNPEGHFKMSKQEGNKLYGVLTLSGVSKEIVFDMEMSDAIIHPRTQKEVIGLELRGKINRKDFGIGKSFLDSTVGDQVIITINLELSK